jgi:hypothetical protein
MDPTQIREQMEVVGSDGQHVGTVDRVEGDQIKLTKGDSDEGVHHLIPTNWIKSVEENQVRLNKISSEAQAEWTETGDGEMRVFAILALLLGSFGLVLAFSDLGPGESWTGRAAVAVLFFILCGFGIGYFNPHGWLLAGLTAWGGVLPGGLIIFAAIDPPENIGVIPPPNISYDLIVLFIPPGLALAGGYMGKRLNQDRNATRPETNG